MNVDLQEKVERAKTLPSYLYVEAATLEQECRKVFHRTWQLIGNLAQLPEVGSYLTAEVSGEPIVVVRGKDEPVNEVRIEAVIHPEQRLATGESV